MSSEAELAKSAMTFGAGVLGISAAIITVVHNRLQKARKQAAKERILYNTWSGVFSVLLLMAFISSLVFPNTEAFPSFAIAALVPLSIAFLGSQSIPSRLEIFAFVISFSSVVFLLLIHLFDKFVAVVSK